jgi:hypothetical protein
VHELLPVLMGGAIALLYRRIRSGIFRGIMSGVLVVLAALLAAWINGETIGWPYFIVADVCFVLAGAVGVNIVFSLLSRARRELVRGEPFEPPSI